MAEKRTCLNCGFLTIQDSELSRPQKIMLGTHGKSAVMPSRPEQTRCFKNLWDYELNYSGGTFDGVIEEIERSRDDCPGFVTYETGFTPAQHLETQLEQRKATVANCKAWFLWRIVRWDCRNNYSFAFKVGFEQILKQNYT